jgi:hypothetical protein
VLSFLYICRERTHHNILAGYRILTETPTTSLAVSTPLSYSLDLPFMCRGRKYAVFREAVIVQLISKQPSITARQGYTEAHSIRASGRLPLKDTYVYPMSSRILPSSAFW